MQSGFQKQAELQKVTDVVCVCACIESFEYVSTCVDSDLQMESSTNTSAVLISVSKVHSYIIIIVGVYNSLCTLVLRSHSLPLLLVIVQLPVKWREMYIVLAVWLYCTNQTAPFVTFDT